MHGTETREIKIQITIFIVHSRNLQTLENNSIKIRSQKFSTMKEIENIFLYMFLLQHEFRFLMINACYKEKAYSNAQK